MIEKVEDQSLGEPLELEGSEDELSKCRKPKIKYTRASLLEFAEVEVCLKLPGDFDLLILRLLDGESDATIEQKCISGDSSGNGPLSRSRWNLSFPGERWDKHLLIPSKESRSQRNCSLERRDVLCQQSPQESAYDAGILSRTPPKNDPFQLSKSENPYRPPHCNKKTPQPLANFSEPGIEFSGESDKRGSADNVAANDKSECGLPVANVDDSTKKPIGECEDSWRNTEGNEMIAATETLGEIIEDNQLTFDDFWAEILEIIHLQQELDISPTKTHANTPDSDVEIHFPDKDSLITVDHSTMPENFNLSNLDNSDDAANSEAELSLPDEESLISIYDMIAPDSLMPTLSSDSLEANKVTSNMAVNTRKNSESLNVTKQGDRSTTVSCEAQSFFEFPGLVAHGKIHSPLSRSQTSTDILGPEQTSLHLGIDQMNSLPKFMPPNIIPCISAPNCFTHSNFHHRSRLESTLTKTKTNDSFVQYSVFEQPIIFPEQQNHLLFDASCPNPTKKVSAPDLSAMRFFPLTSQQSMHQGFGKPNAGK